MGCVVVQGNAYPADDLIVVGEVGLAVLAAVDALGVEVDVVGQAHLGQRSGLAYVLPEGVRVLARWLLQFTVGPVEGSQRQRETRSGVDRVW